MISHVTGTGAGGAAAEVKKNALPISPIINEFTAKT